MENKMYTKPQYKCGVCGTVYDELRERMKCESTCLKRQEEEAKKAAELKKQQERDTRKADVDAKVKAAIEDVNAFANDYGYYTYGGEPVKMTGDICPSKLLHHFLF